MPVMDGLEATRQIHHCPSRKTPHHRPDRQHLGDDCKRCKEAGMGYFAAMPVDPQALSATFLKWLPKVSGAVHLSRLDASPAPTSQAVDPALTPQLRALPGLDLDKGLSRVRGDVGWYLKLLLEFLAFHADDMLQVRKALERHQQSDAIRLAHTLKGAAASLGLTALRAQAPQLETTLASGVGDVQTQIEGIEATWQQLTQSMRHIKQTQAQTAVPIPNSRPPFMPTNLKKPPASSKA